MKYVEGKCGISIFATQSTPNPHKAKHVLNSVYTRVSFLISYVYILSVIWVIKFMTNIVISLVRIWGHGLFKTKALRKRSNCGLLWNTQTQHIFRYVGFGIILVIFTVENSIPSITRWQPSVLETYTTINNLYMVRSYWFYQLNNVDPAIMSINNHPGIWTFKPG